MNAAHFTIQERIVQALKENIIYYAVLGGVGVVIILYLVVKRDLTFSELLAASMAFSNAYGLFVVIALLSYGLVEIPKRLWRLGDRTLTLKAYQFELVGLLENLEKAKKELDDTMKVRSSDAFMPCSSTSFPFVAHDVTIPHASEEFMFTDLQFEHSRLFQVDFKLKTDDVVGEEIRRCNWKRTRFQRISRRNHQVIFNLNSS